VSRNGSKPYLAAAVFAICADTETEAAALERAVDLRRVQMAYGLNLPIPSLAQGAGQAFGERERAVVEREKSRSIIGTPERVTEQLHELQQRFHADELIVLTVAGSYRARLRSYQLLAEAFELK
jgi:alkanesulfonate monooxygenase SsuD/methylene tetrahydromethanopterin reductase-like flavin-dependent oxidoreductase (luciferase family)